MILIIINCTHREDEKKLIEFLTSEIGCSRYLGKMEMPEKSLIAYSESIESISLKVHSYALRNDLELNNLFVANIQDYYHASVYTLSEQETK